MSGLLLLYLISLNLSQLLLNPSYIVTRQTKVNDPLAPKSFQVSLEQMAVLTNLTLNDGFTLDDGLTIENYVSGVYMHEVYNSTSEEYSRKYYMPQNCSEVFPKVEIHPELETMVRGYQCPPVSMSLLGQHGDAEDSVSFMYIVNSCQSMNEIR